MTSATRPDLDEKFGFTKPFQLALEGVATFFSHRSAEPTTVFQRGWILVSALACSPLAHSASKSAATAGAAPTRSEEHTSGLPSLAYLVWRLLLGKKKYFPHPTTLRSASP